MGLAILLSTDHGKIVSDRKVLRPGDYGAILDAGDILNEAQAQARRLAQAASEEYARRVAQAYQEGLARAERDYCARLNALALDSHAQLLGLHTTVANIVVDAVREMLHSADPVQLLNTALEKVAHLIAEEPLLSLLVAPTRLNEAQLAADAWCARQHRDVRMHVEADPDISQETCRIRSSIGLIEVGIDQQLAALRASLDPNASPHQPDNGGTPCP